MGVGGGLLPFNHFWLLKRALSVSNGMSVLKFLRQQVSTISKFLSDAFLEKYKVCVCFFVCMGGGVIRPPMNSNLKNCTRTSDYQSNEPPRKTLCAPRA